MSEAEEVAQVRLVQATVPGVGVYPTNWETVGAQFLYRRDRLLVRSDQLGDIGGRLGIDFNEDPEFNIEGLTRLDLIVPQDEDLDPPLPDRVERIRRDIGDDQGQILNLDHLFYVCIHSCAAIEPEVPVDPSQAPVPGQRPDNSDGGTGVRVSVLDTGLVANAAQDHVWMNGVMNNPAEPDVAGLNPPNDQDRTIGQDGGHGTFTAGCVRVTAPNAEVFVVNAANLLPDGPRTEEVGAAFDSDLAGLLRDLLATDVEAPPHIVVVNFAGTTQNDVPPPALAAVHASRIAGRDDVLVLAPAGNEGQELRTWPGSFDDVISVGGLTDGAPVPLAGDPARYQQGKPVTRAHWSNYGNFVDVYAPGDMLVNAYATGDYTLKWTGVDDPPVRTFDGLATWSGTSFATPLVAGMVATRMKTEGGDLRAPRDAWNELSALADGQPVPYAGPALYAGQELDN